MAKQKTKVELIAENSNLVKEVERLNCFIEDLKRNNKEREENFRQEFARAFGWYETEESSFGYSSKTKKLRTPTWVEIFVELGKLLNVGTVRDFEGNLSEMEVSIENLAKAVFILGMGKNANMIREGETGRVVGQASEHIVTGDVLAVDFKTGMIRKAIPTDGAPKQ